MFTFDLSIDGHVYAVDSKNSSRSLSSVLEGAGA